MVGGRKTADGGQGDGPLEEIRRASVGLEVARGRLAAAVHAARAADQSWADIGDALGITRQAAFKRFGSPTDPRTGRAMTATGTDDVAALTEQTFRLLDAGDHDALRARMTDAAAAVLTRDVLLGTWADAVAETGHLVRCAGTRVELPGGEPAGEEPVLGTVVGATLLECEAGTWAGRVALDPERRLVGLLVVPPGTTGLPF